MDLRRGALLTLLLLSVVAGAHCAHAPRAEGAQAQALGQVRGRVFDDYGASIPDASVTFQPVDPRSGLTEFSFVTDGRGRFDFEGIRTGTYRVTSRAIGYATSVAVHEVRPGVQTEVTLVLRPVKWERTDDR